mgnify:CR=1 FL=1
MSDKLTIRVFHSGYGCDTGCCGHVVDVEAPDGVERERFEFDHPHGADPTSFARELAEHVIRERWPECAATIDWSTVEINSAGARDC